MKQKAESIEHVEVHRCIHCAGVASILTQEHTEKGIWPEIEFCPFCGMSNTYPRELVDEERLETKKLLPR
jgi:hypothetical protein